MNVNCAAATPEDLFRCLFDCVNAKEIADELSSMNECFVLHAPVDRLTLANGSSIATRLIRFFYDAENSLRNKAMPTVEKSIKDEGPY